MSNGFLSQEEIESLLNGGDSSDELVKGEAFTNLEKDLLGEIGNISMGAASTALSTIINQQVNITTPVVSVTTMKELKKTFEVPNIALEVMYTSGITGENLLVMKITDASVIANLMMGGDGMTQSLELSDIEISAVSEAMNQMIGSAATSMATMFSREINISPPNSMIWTDMSDKLSDNIDESESIVQVSFRMIIGDIVDSHIMQLFPLGTAKKIVSIMMGTENMEAIRNSNELTIQAMDTINAKDINTQESHMDTNRQDKPVEIIQQPVEVNKASFQQLHETSSTKVAKNIDLILDVPLEISVVLGRTKKNIKEILNFGTGSLIELDKLTEEPVEILVNGKRVAYGEVVVVDENFGVRISSIVSSVERVKSLRD